MQEFLWTFRRAGQRAIIGLLLSMLAACEDPAPAATVAVGACGLDGHLKAQLYGDIEAMLDWKPADLQCQGMPRPYGAGARLRFSGLVASGAESTQLAFILGIPDLKRGQTAKELPTNVTVIDEGQGRFYATQNTESCWSDIDRQQLREGATQFVISGVLYCLAPLAELHGNGSIRFTDVHFTGLLDWKPPE